MPSPQELAYGYSTPRARRIEKLWAYVTGTQYNDRLVDWLDNSNETPLFDRRPCINYPITRIAIQGHVGFVLGEGRWPTLTSATSEDDREFDAEWGLNEADSDTLDRFVNVVLLRYAELQNVAVQMLGDAMGAKSVAVVCSLRGGKLFSETVRSSWCSPTINEYGDCVKLEIRYPYIEEWFNTATKKWEERCMLYRRVIDDVNDTVYQPAQAKDDFSEPDWAEDKEKTIAGGHGLGFCPVIWYPFMQPAAAANDVDGVAIQETQLREIDALNVTLSQKQRAAVVAGDPTVIETGVSDDVNPAPMGNQARAQIVDAAGPDGKKIGIFGTRPTSPGGRGKARKRGAGVAWRYPDDKSRVSYLLLPGDALKAVDEHGKDLRTKLCEAFSVVFVDPGELHTRGAMSGTAMELMFLRQLLFDANVRNDFANKALIPLISMLLRIIHVVGQKTPNGIYLPGLKKVLPILKSFERAVEAQAVTSGEEQKKPKTIWLPPRLEPVWGPWFSPNEQDQLAVVQAVVQALQAHAITTEQAVEKLSSAGVFPAKSARKIVEAIQAEISQQNETMAATMHALKPDPKQGGGAGGSNGAPGVAGGGAPGGGATPTGNAPAANGTKTPAGATASPGAGAAANAAQKAAVAQPTGAIHERGLSTMGVAEAVHAQLLEDFPESALGWVKAATWQGPEDVPLDSIDFSNVESWEASKDGTVDEFVAKIEGGMRKPIILVNEPDNEKLIAIDGHHRLLAYQQLGMPAVAYIATVGTVNGPWDRMHDQQSHGGRPKPPAYVKKAKAGEQDKAA